MSDIKYTDYVCIIKPQSAFLTPFQADTVWGSLMWAYRYLYGNSAMEEILSEPPKLIVSDGFPVGMLPRPKNFIPITKSEKIIKGIIDNEESEIDDRQILINYTKSLAKVRHFPEDLVFEMLKGNKTDEDILKSYLIFVSKKLDEEKKDNKFLKEYFSKEGYIEKSDEAEKKTDSDKQAQERIEHQLVRHNVIDRITMTARKKHGLYTHRETYYHCDIQIFIRTILEKEKIFQLFKFLADNGYGKRKSTGKGQLKIKSLEVHDKFPDINNSNGFMTLSSSYVPVDHEVKLDESRYTVHIKRGKVGGHYANEGKYLKYPIAMYQAGSIFKKSGVNTPYYGRYIENVHSSRKEIVHYGFAFPLVGKDLFL